jgi:hypothetical protein
MEGVSQKQSDRKGIPVYLFRNATTIETATATPRRHRDACLSEYQLLRNRGDKRRQSGDQRNQANESDCGSSFLFAHVFS